MVVRVGAVGVVDRVLSGHCGEAVFLEVGKSWSSCVGFRVGIWRVASVALCSVVVDLVEVVSVDVVGQLCSKVFESVA
eukprot:759101-Rhodomonas_salina.1